jgi:Ca2+-binding RTX toxin-like protein
MQNNRKNRSFRKIATACTFEAMENRQMMAATGYQSVDTAGPIEQLVEAGGSVYISSRHGSGSTVSQIWSAKGAKSQSKLLVDFTKAGETHSTIDNLVSLPDGRVFFAAHGPNGHQLYQVKPGGGYTQITNTPQAYYSKVAAVGNKLFLYDSTNQKLVTLNSKNEVKLVKALDSAPHMFSAKEQLFFMQTNGSVFRTDGSEAGTYQVTPAGYNPGASKIFVTNDYLYMEISKDNNTSLYRSNGAVGSFTKVADDYSLFTNDHAEIGDYVYFSGSFYNTSPSAKGRQLYRIQTSTGEVSPATTLSTTNGGGSVSSIAAIGNNIYFAANDGDFLGSQGTYDRELFRYNVQTGTTTLVTKTNTLYPVDEAGAGTGVLSSYYFVAAPTKDDARFGSRALYRTSPTGDSVEKVTNLPTTTESNVTGTEVSAMAAGSAGLFAVVQTAAFGKDTDLYFVPTPYSYIDPVTKILTVEATEATDTMTMKVIGEELVMNLNGIEERQQLSAFTTIYVSLKAGDDKLTTNANLTKSMSVVGDSGNDSIMTGSGNDSILGGAGKNYMYGMNGNDRLRGSSGYDYCEGGEGLDRIYGRGGSDNLHGNNGVDVIYGDDDENGTGNDTLYGESSNDKLYGFGGNDELYGGNQNDSLFAGSGDDKLYGQAGNDTLDGGAGKDLMLGLDGDDRFIANDGEFDQILGGNGNDKADKDANESKYEEVEAILE